MIMRTYNRTIHILTCLFAALLCALPITAQTEYITSSRTMDADRFEDLDGGYGLLVISPHKDLIFNMVDAGVKYTSRMNGRTADGNCEYYIIVDAASTHHPKVEISRRGNVYKTEIVENLKADYMVAFRVEEVTNPIRYDNQTSANDVRFNAKEAELEFTTTIKDLKVKLSPLLGAGEPTTKVSKADNNIYVTTVVIPVERIKEAKESSDRLTAEHDALEAKLTSGSYEASNDEWEKEEELKRQADEAARNYSEMVCVEIFSEGSNHLSIDISDMGPRTKKCYAVLPLVIEHSVFVTECSAYMSEGGRLFAQRKYGDARAAYLNALSSKDLIPNMRPTIDASISECDSCIFYEKLAVGAIKRFNEMRKNGNATQREAAKYASAASEFLGILNNYNPDEFYTSRIEKFDKFLADIPLNIKFTTVEWKTLMEGNPLQGIELWAYYGTMPITSAMFPTDRKFRKMLDSHAADFTQLGVSDANGKVAIELNRQKLPTGILFRPKDNKDVKIKYLEFNDLMRQARGTYMEKQFRLKMYTK